MILIKENKSTQKVLTAMRRKGLVRPRDLIKIPNVKVHLRRLAHQGRVQQFGRGIYGLNDHAFTRHHSYAVVCKQAPHGVICLLSALAFHGITSQNPGRVWLAIDQKAWAPQIKSPKIQIMRFSGKSFTEGIRTIKMEGVEIQVYNVAKTVADLFKFRNKVGLDVAMEALKESLKKRRCSIDELLRYARICRVEKVMRPYLEMVVVG